MDASQALREMVEASGLTHRQIARRMGRYDAYVSQVLTRSPGADVLASIANACGYRLELVPIDGGESIAIGDLSSIDGNATQDPIAQTRALLTRALANLDSLEPND